MTDQTDRGSSDIELERALRDLGAHLAYPPAVDLLPAVRARIEHRGSGFAQLLWSPRFAVVPALATVVILLIATVAFQPVAATAAEALGLRGLVIFRTAQTPSPATPRPSASASASPGGVLFDAHRVASVDDASREVGFRVLVPSALGPPDEVHVRVTGQDAQAFLVYQPRGGIPPSSQTGIGVLITEVRGSFEVQLLGKLLGPGSKAEELKVSGAPAVWIEGAPHQFFYRAPNGQFIQDTLRLSGNVLVYDEPSGLLVRIEADVGKDRALAIASSLR